MLVLDMLSRWTPRYELEYIEVFTHLNEPIGVSVSRQGDTGASHRFTQRADTY